MKKYTQSELSPGNCWQTAVACILEVDPVQFPPQSELEVLNKEFPKLFNGYGIYGNVLRAYLSKHHRLNYVSIDEANFGAVRPNDAFAVLVGPTVRTDELKAAGKSVVNHCVVGYNGVTMWDPHPSRDGLLNVIQWGCLGPEQKSVRELNDHRLKMKADDVAYCSVFNCLCPECGLIDARKRAHRLWVEKEDLLSKNAEKKVDVEIVKE